MTRIVFCVPGYWGSWLNILDRNDSFVYHARRFAEDAGNKVFMVLTGLENDTIIRNKGFHIFIRTADKFDKTIETLMPDVVVALSGLPCGSRLDNLPDSAFKVLFYAGGDYSNGAPLNVDHVAVHHPWQLSIIREANNLGVNDISDVQGGVDVDMFKPTHTQKHRRAIYPANLTPGKRQHLAAAACEKVNLPLILCGRTDEDAAYVNYMRQFSNVMITYTIRHFNMPNEFNLSALSPITTMREAGPHVLLESMACEVPPIVCGDCEATSNVMKMGGFNEFVAEPDVESLAVTIDNVLDRVSGGERFDKMSSFIVNNYSLAAKFHRFKELLDLKTKHSFAQSRKFPKEV